MIYLIKRFEDARSQIGGWEVVLEKETFFKNKVSHFANFVVSGAV